MTDGSFAHGLVGVTLDGRYRLDAVLGEGGMGAVFRATHVALDRRVAVKLLKPHLTSDHAALERFAREARTTRRVESPHAVKVLDFGVTPLGDYYMVLEYLDGRTVQRELEIDGPFAPARVVHIARQTLEALAVAHDQGLIHRDVKPDNLLLMRVGGDPDFTKVLDFGVAKLMQGAAGARSQLALTAAGMVFGTPELMSPEQACGQELDGRSDLYSLAATMFVMLTGVPLFEGKAAIELLTHHARTPPPHLAMARPELAAYPELDQLLQRCLAKHRDQRPHSAAELAAQLAELEPSLRRPTGPLARPVTLPTPAVRASGYVPALQRGPSAEPGDVLPGEARPREREPGEAERDRALDEAARSLGTATTGVVATAPRRSRRGPMLALGGAVIAALFAVAIGASIRRTTSGTTSITAPRAATSVEAGIPGPAPNAMPDATTDARAEAVTATRRGRPAIDAGPPAVEAPGPAPTALAGRGAQPARRPAAAEAHLRTAEEAFSAGNRLKQLAEADLALQANPRSVRAKFLLADALIKGTDLDRGCAYLRSITRYPPARALARLAACPGD